LVGYAIQATPVHAVKGNLPQKAFTGVPTTAVLHFAAADLPGEYDPNDYASLPVTEDVQVRPQGIVGCCKGGWQGSRDLS